MNVWALQPVLGAAANPFVHAEDTRAPFATRKRGGENGDWPTQNCTACLVLREDAVKTQGSRRGFLRCGEVP